MGGEHARVGDDDRELLDLVRAGDPDAYAELYARHSVAAHRFARSLVANRADADDAVAEVFASLLATLRRGRGPTERFLPYLLTSIRNECHRVNRRGTRESVARFDRLGSVLDARRLHDDPENDLAEAEVITSALTTLPDNLREILWRTEVREEPARVIAAQRGATPHAVAESALRARHALGSAYLQLHAAGGARADDLEPGCRDARPYLAAYVRRSVGSRRRRHIERHLLTCEGCADAHEELGRVNRRLRLVPALPIDAGAAGTASLGIKAQIAAWISASAAPIAASGMVVVTVLSPVPRGPDSVLSEPAVGADHRAAVPAQAPPAATTIVVPPVIDRSPEPHREPGVAEPVVTPPIADAPAPIAPAPIATGAEEIAPAPAATAPVPDASAGVATAPVSPSAASTAPSPLSAPPPAADPPPAAAEQPVVAAEQPVVAAEQPVVAAEQPVVDTGAPAAPPANPGIGNASGIGGGVGNGRGVGQPMLGNGEADPPAVGVNGGEPGPPPHAAASTPGPPVHATAVGHGDDGTRPATAASAPGAPGNPVAAEHAADGNGNARRGRDVDAPPTD